MTRRAGLRVAALAVTVGLFGAGSSATAAAGRPAALPGPSSFATGMLASQQFVSPDAGIRATWFNRLQAIDSNWFRLTAVWLALVSPHPDRGFNPSNPNDRNYYWSGLDTAVREATAHGQRILMTILDAPSWALVYTSGPPGFNSSPKAAAVGAFARALAVRYSGHFPDPAHPHRTLPRVSYFQAWNEPNLPALIAPQWTRNRAGNWVAASPAIYRNILNAVYTNVKAAQPHDYVLSAGLAPYGDTPGRPYNRMHPVTFLSDLLCLQGPRLRPGRCPQPAHLDALDVHPYSLTPTSSAYNPDDVSITNLSRLQAVLRAAERGHRIFPAGPKPIWVTEIGWTSKPPDPYGIPLSRQASYLAQAFYELWRQGVSHVFWWLVSDYPYKSLAGAGVYYQSGQAKASAVAFRFPFVALAGARHSITLWGRAPKAGVVTVQFLRRGRWYTALKVRTTAAGVFYTSRRLGSHLTLRAVIARYTSLSWSNV